MTRKSGKHPHATYGILNSCFDFTTVDRTNNHSMQKPKLYLWATGSCHV